MTGDPWAVAADAPREAAPAELFQKQVHRGDLKALAIIGAGEYGEVLLPNYYINCVYEQISLRTRAARLSTAHS